MNLHKILKTVPPQWQAVARHYANLFDAAGVPADKIDRLIEWGMAYTGSRDEADVLSAFREQATRIGLEEHVTASAADLGLEAREKINSGKFVPEPVQQDDDTRLLADIRQFRRDHPDAWDQDSEMQAVERRLLSASMGEEPAPGASPVQPSPSLDADMRLKEIRQMRRDDPHSWESNAVLQKEELGLIEAQIASQPAAEAPAPTASSSPSASQES